MLWNTYYITPFFNLSTRYLDKILELDSDTSSLAAWSFSMATPTTLQPYKEVPSNIHVGEMSSTITTSPSVVEEDEGGMSSDESSHRALGREKSAHGKTLLKITDKVLIKNKVHCDYCLHTCNITSMHQSL